MIIKEVPAEGNLTIEVSLKERKLEFHSQCVESGVNYIYAQPIRIDGKILSFNSEGHLMVNLIYLREEKKYFSFICCYIINKGLVYLNFIYTLAL